MTFDEKLAAWEAKQREPYMVPKSKNNGVPGGPKAGKRIGPKEFERLRSNIKALHASRGSLARIPEERWSKVTPPAEQERRLQLTDQWLRENRRDTR